MNKLNKAGGFFAAIALVAAASSASAQTVDNWRAADGTVWRSGADATLCARNAGWTPATGVQGCDGVPAPAAAAPAPVAAAPAPVAAAPAAAVVPAVVPGPTTEKVTYSADALFDFDKAVLKPEGKAKLDDLAGKVKEITLEVIVATGHTDSVGADAYNQKLSVRRAEAVKAYLTGKGVEASRVYTEGKGETAPVADNKTADGRAKNRRVVIEVVGTRAKQ